MGAAVSKFIMVKIMKKDPSAVKEMGKAKDTVCWCMGRKTGAIAVAVITLYLILAQTISESIIYAHGDKTNQASFIVTILGETALTFVLILLYIGIWKERPGMMWPYLVWVSLFIGLGLFQTMILVYINQTQLNEVKEEVMIYFFTILLYVVFVHVIQKYEVELRAREEIKYGNPSAAEDGDVDDDDSIPVE